MRVSTAAVRRLDPWAITAICAVALTRFVSRSHLLYDIDSVNFALGILRFDPAAHQPHPPGYFLYICLGRLVNRFVGDPNAALVAISIAASCGAAWMIYLLAQEWFDREAARMSLIIFLFSPLCWFHGVVALTYIVEVFFSGLVGFLCWRVYAGRTGLAIPAAIAFGVAAGFRPSTAMLLGPLLLISLWRAPRRRRVAAILAMGGAILLWLLPMASAAGGVRELLGSAGHLWSTVAGRRTTLASPWLAVARTVTIAWIFVLCFGSASLLLLRWGRSGLASDSDRRRFVKVWTVPGFLFFAFVFLNYVNSGYLLVLSPPVFAILAARLSAYCRHDGNRGWRHIAIVCGAAANCAVFAFAPLYCTHRGIRQFEADMAAIQQDFQTLANPQKTLLIGFDSHFLGYRHAGYYLPQFVTVQYPEVGYADGQRVFLMYGRDTVLARELATDSFDRFILFPLPQDDGYARYLKTVLARLPAGAIQTATLGGRTVLTGPIGTIPLLFSTTAARSPKLSARETQH
jgi:hypothetical protein